MYPSNFIKIKKNILEKYRDFDDDCQDMENRIAEDFLTKSCDTKNTPSKVSNAKTST
jgi:hypothetical protein